MPQHDDEGAHEAGRRTLIDADIEVVSLHPRIGRRFGSAQPALATYQPSDHWDVRDYHPPRYDDTDVGVDADNFDGDIWATSH